MSATIQYGTRNKTPENWSAVRITSKEGTRGSLKWIQRLINNRPALLDAELCAAGILPEGESVTWVSPIKSDDWAEYRDGEFLKKLGLESVVSSLREFWPARGPQWDAFGRSGDKVYLVEAKAHVDEMASGGSASAESSIALIGRSLIAARTAFGAREDADWHAGHYQYANRLAHLHFLRQHGIDAHLVFVYFTGDADMRGPGSRHEWSGAIGSARNHLGFENGSSTPGVTDVFIDISGLN